MPTVEFIGFKTVTCEAGETLLEVAIANEVPVDHACGGVCACSTCHVVLEDHVYERLEDEQEMQDKEMDRLDKAKDISLTSRLACQIKVTTDMKVKIPNPGWGH